MDNQHSSGAFDGAFSAYERSPRVQELFGAVFDEALPPELELFSFVPADGLRDIAERLRLGPGKLLVDMACGRGGPGFWLARETGARLLGVDFSPVAVRQASERAASFGRTDHATFRVGEFGACGLEPAVADAVVCVDAIQFAPDPLAAFVDLFGATKPGAWSVFTTWQPPPEVTEPGADFAAAMTEAGYVDVAVEEYPDWEDRRRAVYEAALAVDDPRDADGTEDSALESLRREARTMLPVMASLRRVLIAGRRPG